MQTAVAQTVDRLEMHATATAILLDVQDKLGDLCREALRITSNGRRPFRPTQGWESAIAELSFTILSLADQTGIDLEQAVQKVVMRLSQGPAYGPPGPGGPGPGPGPGPVPGPGHGPGPGHVPGPGMGPGPGGPKPPANDGWPLSY